MTLLSILNWELWHKINGANFKIKKEYDFRKPMEKNNTIEVCLGVGLDQIFPEYIKIDLSEVEPSPISMNRIGLINYEGDCLRAIKKDSSIIIKDQYGETLAQWEIDEFQKFIDGEIEIEDSKGKSWNFQKEHHNARQSANELTQFIQQFL
jgi:hypothetical protein